jgi:hypothetical protein
MLVGRDEKTVVQVIASYVSAEIRIVLSLRFCSHGQASVIDRAILLRYVDEEKLRKRMYKEQHAMGDSGPGGFPFLFTWNGLLQITFVRAASYYSKDT